VNDLSKHIKKRIREVEDEEFFLNPIILNLSKYTWPHPMSTIHTQSLLNKLCTMDDVGYLEVGVHQGASYFAAAYNNSGAFYGVDNWSLYGIHQGLIERYIAKFQAHNRIFYFFNENSWSLDLNKFEHKINILFYDGDHSYESQRRVLKFFDKILDNEIILIVDDCAEEHIQKATEIGIQESNFKIISDYKLLDNKKWHNGLYVAHLKRKIK
jgi:hypothetical protein